jgi:hypothetical protein
LSCFTFELWKWQYSYFAGDQSIRARGAQRHERAREAAGLLRKYQQDGKMPKHI